MTLYLKGRAKRAEKIRDTISTKLRICIFFSPRIDTISTKHYFYRRAERAREKYVTISTESQFLRFYFPKILLFLPTYYFSCKVEKRVLKGGK